jgi:hypothetical protein
MDGAPPLQGTHTQWPSRSVHNFTHLGSDCNTVSAEMTLLYATVQFSLHTDAECLPLLRDLPAYHACVNVMEFTHTKP